MRAPCWQRGNCAKPIARRSLTILSGSNLDGSLSDEQVDDAVRKVARQQLDGIAARAAQKAEKLRIRQERKAQHQILEPDPASMPACKDVSA